ncbi:uncharacterized protein LOC117178965 isoform X2 [Belonocnema kinseyi]|nr:uncharacterized protein LOC117178965 isoform X2 [Belonocnema kinseyi]
MYELFGKKYPEIKLSVRAYDHVFKTDLNLRFGLPRSDTCTVCDKFFIDLSAAHNEEGRNLIAVECEAHQIKAESGYATLRADSALAKENPKYIVICTDLQQVLYYPTLNRSSVFYQRQYSDYNSAIHNMDFSPWETTTRRDPKLKITHAAWLRITKEDPTAIQVRTKHQPSEECETFSLIVQKEALPRNRETVKRKTIYSYIELHGNKICADTTLF